MAQVCIFLSAVSAEFRRYLDLPNVTVKVQEDFIMTGTETLEMLVEYIRRFEVIIHLVCDMTSAMAQPRIGEPFARDGRLGAGHATPLLHTMGSLAGPISR